MILFLRSKFLGSGESSLAQSGVKRYFNPFVPNAPFLNPLKTPENRKVF